MKAACCALLRERASDAGLGGVVSARCAMVEEFDGVQTGAAAMAAGGNGGNGGSGANGHADDDSGVDVVLGLHACGNATDYIQEQALRLGAAYVLSPCCIGKLAFSLAGGTSFGAGRGAYGDTARVAATAVTAISHPRVALDGDDSSSALGRLVTIRGEGFVAGPGARSELVGCCQLRYFQAKQLNIAICYVQLHVPEFVP